MNFHILDEAEDGKTINVVFHFAVPASNNQAGISYQTALVLYLGGASSITSKVATAEELANLQAGSLYERTASVRYSKLGLTPVQKLNEVKAAFTSMQAAETARLQQVLAFEGYQGNVS